MNGKITRIISNLYTVKCGELVYGCRARGKFRNIGISPVVGDNVVIDPDENYILDVEPRRNELKRPVIANVDMCFIVTSTKKPDLDLVLLDKLLSIVIYNEITPVICFTKLDLLNEIELETIDNIKKYYEMIGIKCVYNSEKGLIKKLIENKTVVLAGQTGAGKSSLINSLDESLHIETNEISEALGRGKHTTRHVELYEIADGYIADTPGFSALDINEIGKEELKYTFPEFDKYDCRFRDCMHNKENDCGVKKAVEEKLILQSRYNNYLLFLEEVEK